jgi:hypothetical protein
VRELTEKLAKAFKLDDKEEPMKRSYYVKFTTVDKDQGWEIGHIMEATTNEDGDQKHEACLGGCDFKGDGMRHKLLRLVQLANKALTSEQKYEQVKRRQEILEGKEPDQNPQVHVHYCSALNQWRTCCNARNVGDLVTSVVTAVTCPKCREVAGQLESMSRIETTAAQPQNAKDEEQKKESWRDRPSLL